MKKAKIPFGAVVLFFIGVAVLAGCVGAVTQETGSVAQTLEAIEIITSPENPPRLFVTLQAETVQQIQAVGLGQSWTIFDEHGNIVYAFNSDSPSPLQLLPSDFDEATFYLNHTSSEIEMYFSDNFPPHTVYVRRWPAEYALSDQVLYYQYEAVVISNNIVNVSDNRRNYIYEVKAIWEQGRATFAFRLNSMNTTELIESSIANEITPNKTNYATQ